MDSSRIGQWRAVAALVCLLAGSARGGEGATNAPVYPPPVRTLTYTGTNGTEHLYLVREPQGGTLRQDAPVLIYMHGNGGKEEQGMVKLFPDLRPLLDRLGWLYACPRDADFEGLRRDLALRYGNRTLYLAGASSGGKLAFHEALANPDRYAGLILMCPAVRRKIDPDQVATNAAYLPMPVWMICGENDTNNVAVCRALNQGLERRGHSVFYHEIPGGSHNDAPGKIRWEEALAFVAGKAGGH
jgi:pimeloyl-ACP methyl ester carboxylesterase